MGRAKRGRKIRTGNKMVRVALRKQAALHAMQMAVTIANFRVYIGCLIVQRMKKGGSSPVEITLACKNDVTQPLTELIEKLELINDLRSAGKDAHVNNH